MSNALLEAMGDVSYLMDTPGAYLRGALSGKLGDRASGEEMLGSWGVDAGPMGGLAAEMVADPLALAGIAGGAYKGIQGLTRAARGLSHADDANPLLRAVAGLVGDESGALRPFQEIGRRTDPDWVNTRDWFHGTATPGLTPETLDPMLTKETGLFGRGVYKTSNPRVASGYATARAESAPWKSYRQIAQELYDRRLAETGRTDTPWPAEAEITQALRNAIPQPIVYKAETNLGKIADLDAPVTEELKRAFEQVALRTGRHSRVKEHLYDLWSEGRPAGDMLQYIHPASFKGFDPSAPDEMIRALRERGIDALTHTGGIRAGRDKTLHDVLISLDPNDTISQVGRANQITRLEPQQIEDLMRQMRGLQSG